MVLDAATGRGRYGERPPGPYRLAELERIGAAGSTENLLVHGEAFEAMSALCDAGRSFRLCYIDPPYNTGQELHGFDDRAAHDVWLACLEERARLARELLCPGGFFVAHTNVVEQAYLKVLLDEIFGRQRLISQVSWQRSPDRTVLGQGSALVSDQVEYLLIYVKERVDADWPRPVREIPLSEKTLLTYSRVLAPSTGSRLVTELTGRGGVPAKIYAHDSYALESVPARTLREAARRVPPAVEAVFPRLCRLTNQQPESTFQQELLRHMPEPGTLYRAEYQQTRGKHRGPRARYYLGGNVVLWLRDVAVLRAGRLVRQADLNNFWSTHEVPVTGIAREGGVAIRRGKKPERLMERVIEAFSRPGDAVLDFFAGSGTTGAVAERLGRRWVLCEAGENATRLCLPRLSRAVAETGGAFALARVKSPDRG